MSENGLVAKRIGLHCQKGMETRVLLPKNEPPISIREVVLALEAEKLDARHDKQNWGDWINFDGKQTVVAIESNRGLAASAVIEGADDEEETCDRILAAFRKLRWLGEDEDGQYQL